MASSLPSLLAASSSSSPLQVPDPIPYSRPVGPSVRPSVPGFLFDPPLVTTTSRAGRRRRLRLRRLYTSSAFGGQLDHHSQVGQGREGRRERERGEGDSRRWPMASPAAFASHAYLCVCMSSRSGLAASNFPPLYVRRALDRTPQPSSYSGIELHTGSLVAV